ncbi:hypothetical protein PMAYCL1PPCAC_27481, partial [Pristionchus mayeri]
MDRCLLSRLLIPVFRLKVVDTQKAESHMDPPESPSWESLPWPPLERIFYHLWTNGDCLDLTNLAKVSTFFHAGVMEFMKRDINQPALEKVFLSKCLFTNKITCEIALFRSNLPYYDLSGLDWSRFDRVTNKPSPTLVVNPTGIDDVIVDQ